MVLAGFAMYAALKGIHSADLSDAPLILASPAVGYVAALLAFVRLPGGLGAREGGSSVVLAVAVPLAVASAAAVAMRLIQRCIEIVCAGAAPFVARTSARRGS